MQPFSENEAALLEKYDRTFRRIRELWENGGTSPSCPELCVVTKYHGTAKIKLLIDRRKHRIFGENYAQELSQKVKILKEQGLTPEDVQFDFIGKLQLSNVNTLIKGCDGYLRRICTIDNIRLAKKVNDALSSRRPKAVEFPPGPCAKDGDQAGSQRQLGVLIQLNCSSEPQKNGIDCGDTAAIEELISFIGKSCPFLRIDGLMAVASTDHAEEDFKRLRALIDSSLSLKLPVLSIGMTDDMPLAIKYGSTQVRIGTAIMGTRPQTNDLVH